MADKAKLIFLGTGSAVPTAKRNHPAMLIQFKEENILIDCGEGTQRQFRKARINPCKITKLLITHWHGDHVLGLPGLLQTLMLNEYNKTLEIYGPKGTKDHMKRFMDLFVQKGKQSQIEVKEINSGKFFENSEFLLEAEKTDHDTQGLAYSFTIKEKRRLDKKKLEKLKLPNGPLIGKLQREEKIKLDGKTIDGKKLVYTESERKITIILDTLKTKELEKFSKDSDILICESTYSTEEKELAKEHFHMTSDQTAQLAKDSKSKKLYLTHLSQKYDTKTQQKQILDEAKKVFKNTELAEDFLEIEF
jgi:ribonuclease Z